MALFSLMLQKLYVRDNRESRVFPFTSPSTAEAVFYTFATSSDDSILEIGKALDATDRQEQIDFLKSAVSELTQKFMTVDLPVKDNSTIPFGGPSGKGVYISDEIPEYLHFTVLGVERDVNVTDLATNVERAITENSDEFDGFLGALVDAAKISTSPYWTVASKLLDFITKVYANRLDKNDLIGVYYSTLIKHLDYPKGNLKILNSWDSTKNMQVNYEVIWIE